MFHAVSPYTRSRIRRKRPSLRLIISSATLDATYFLDYFNGTGNEATIVSLEGRSFPVEVAYLQEPTADYVRKAVEVAWQLNIKVRNRFAAEISTTTSLI